MAGNSDRAAALRVVRTVLAADCACAEEAFVGEGVVIVDAQERPGRRRFPVGAKPLALVTMGAGTVVSCHPDRAAWLRANLARRQRDHVFSAPIIAQLAEHIAPDRQDLRGPDLKYICSRETFRPAGAPGGIPITVSEGDDIAALYARPGFENALSYRSDHARPDVAATVATHAGDIIGIAGASADCEALWQIGVDVVPAFRGRGIGRALVSGLTETILRRVVIPYYSTAASNIRSRALAISLGYFPAWVELYAVDR